MWIVGEDMPQEKNAVTLNTDVKDQNGMPVPNVHFDDHDNDIKMRKHALEKVLMYIMQLEQLIFLRLLLIHLLIILVHVE